MFNLSLEFISLLISVPFLCYACYSDLQIREVGDKIWIILLGIAFLINFARIFYYHYEITLIRTGTMSVIIGIVLAFLLVSFGVWGGADGKCFICLSLLSPFQARSNLNIFDKAFPTSFIVFMNSYLFLIPLPFLIFLFNLNRIMKNKELYLEPETSFLKKALCSFIGWPESINITEKRHHWHYDFLESKTEGKWNFKFGMTLGDPEEDLNRRLETLKQLKNDGKECVWIQPSVPFLIPMVFGYFSAILFGNLMVKIIEVML